MRETFLTNEITSNCNVKISFRFHSNPYQTRFKNKGFHIEYDSLKLFTACGGTYTNSSGILTAPSHQNSYPVLSDCVYLISQPDRYINISFLNMDISCQGTPSYYIEMRDGNSEESPLMGRFCGNNSNVPDFMQTTQNHLRIR